ncbi:uncharacterized protein EV422DRAFT_569325 [Fimicolochytrium jonesii]|uniref:uncharacterized protein n=1 Tax=Fimicolochytrium jonesii TaxID=1396493 RepID=UPI0022FE229C|nr:uncharacterized protein EV422DRAFT_569325 [Fimicolochytrium jonesii]KAI8819050.1 hypothetical protein EV422DRAFT_569325 [Fimicolochytrium jonesii]
MLSLFPESEVANKIAARPDWERTLGYAGWAAMGVFTQAFALALQHRPVLERPYKHVLFAGAFVGLGYALNTFQDTQLHRLEQKRDRLVRRRMLRVTEGAAALDGEGAVAH